MSRTNQIAPSKPGKKPMTMGRMLLLALYYALILLGALYMHMNNSFSAPSFVYQGF